MKYEGWGFGMSGGDRIMLFGGIVWGRKLYVMEVNGFLAAAYPGGEAGEAVTPY